MSTNDFTKITKSLRTTVILAVALAVMMAPLQTIAATKTVKSTTKLSVSTSTTTIGTVNAAAQKSTTPAKTPKPTAPKISITSPVAKATVSGTGTITANVTDAQGIASVQYKLDGANLGTAVTTAPYSLSWNTTTATNASHSLTAVATNIDNLSTTSAAVTVTVNNVAPVPTSPPPSTYNPASNYTPTAKVSFTFDDGLNTAITQAAPTLYKYGLVGTDYAITGCVGMTTEPNTCRANTDTTYMTWAQIQSLQNNYGWEIGSHTVDHDCLASSAAQDPDDCQANTLTTAQVVAELVNSKAALAANGVNATDFAPPYGDYNNNVLAQIAKSYATMRQFKNAADNANVWPYSDYYLQDYTVQETTDTVADVEAQINNAITNKQWLILTFHNIEPSPSKTPDDYEYGTAELDQIAAYVQAKEAANQISSVTVSQGLVTSSTNLLPNGSFNDGIADGWTTDAPANVTADSGDNGSYPDPTNSIKMTSPATGSAHLFSPKVAVTPGTTYMLKNFLNLQSITSGEVAYYVDEYDNTGHWISGQYLKQETSSFVEDMNFAYTPSSANVASASLQIIASGSGITAYLDNAQWFPLSTPAPVTPPATQTNLMPNEGFDDGIADGWTTDDPTNITADNGNNGSPNNPVNSVKLVAGTTAANTHLFSPKITVDSTKSYTITTYLNIQTLTSGEVAFYVDEYDASGNWISGQYKVGVTALGPQNVSFTYIPTSANVASASLQIIVVGNSGITAYVDDARWYQN